MICEINLPTYY